VIVNCLLGAKCQAVPRQRAMHACRGLQNLWDLKTSVSRALQADLLPTAANLQSCSCYRPTHELRVLQVCVQCAGDQKDPRVQGHGARGSSECRIAKIVLT
jgi:hypothetical protein